MCIRDRHKAEQARDTGDHGGRGPAEAVDGAADGDRTDRLSEIAALHHQPHYHRSKPGRRGDHRCGRQQRRRKHPTRGGKHHTQQERRCIGQHRQEDADAGEAHDGAGHAHEGRSVDAAREQRSSSEIADNVGAGGNRTQQTCGLQRNAHAIDQQDRKEVEQRKEHQAVERKRNGQQSRATGAHRCGRVAGEPAPGELGSRLRARHEQGDTEQRDDGKRAARPPTGAPACEQRRRQHRESDARRHEATPEREREISSVRADGTLQQSGAGNGDQQEAQAFDDARSEQYGVSRCEGAACRPECRCTETEQKDPPVTDAGDDRAGGDSAQGAEDREDGGEPADRSKIEVEIGLQKGRRDGRLANLERCHNSGADDDGNGCPSDSCRRRDRRTYRHGASVRFRGGFRGRKMPPEYDR